MGRHKKSHGNAWPKHAFALIAFIFILLSAATILAGDLIVIDVKDAISPPVGSYITENIDRAVKEKADAIMQSEMLGATKGMMPDVPGLG